MCSETLQEHDFRARWTILAYLTTNCQKNCRRIDLSGSANKL